MPRKSDNNSNLIREENTGMDIEEQANHEEIEELDLENIEKFIIDSESGYSYNPEEFKECFIPQNDLAKEITLNTLKVRLVKLSIKSNPKIKYKGSDEIYIINKNWYTKWQQYSRHKTIKRCIRAYSTYSTRPIKFTPKEKDNPGQINNNNLYIKNNINNNDGRNILISKNNDAFDTKVGVKLVSRDVFNLLKAFYKCDTVIKAKCDRVDYNNYDLFSVHLNMIFKKSMMKIIRILSRNTVLFMILILNKVQEVMIS